MYGSVFSTLSSMTTLRAVFGLTVIAMTAAGGVYLVKQYSGQSSKKLLEVPA